MSQSSPHSLIFSLISHKYECSEKDKCGSGFAVPTKQSSDFHGELEIEGNETYDID
jgi:hypothetical protein